MPHARIEKGSGSHVPLKSSYVDELPKVVETFIALASKKRTTTSSSAPTIGVACLPAKKRKLRTKRDVVGDTRGNSRLGYPGSSPTLCSLRGCHITHPGPVGCLLKALKLDQSSFYAIAPKLKATLNSTSLTPSPLDLQGHTCLRS
ncbi:hypothetical protein HAX54_039691 [Datura stramonium]|uniref:Uncharacterized protein n=1 Tax=Datura stramonium TaxID=4076 RepID=A0ABS8VNF3_DATST|nr:hypothetical protein [Datura stramonium]